MLLLTIFHQVSHRACSFCDDVPDMHLKNSWIESWSQHSHLRFCMVFLSTSMKMWGINFVKTIYIPSFLINNLCGNRIKKFNTTDTKVHYWKYVQLFQSTLLPHNFISLKFILILSNHFLFYLSKWMLPEKFPCQKCIFISCLPS